MTPIDLEKVKETQMKNNLINCQFTEQLEKEMIHKRLHEINSFQCVRNELYLVGKDEMGNDFTLCFDAFNFLEWIDKEHIEYIKQKVIEYVEEK